MTEDDQDIQISQSMLQRIAARWVHSNERSPEEYRWFLENWRHLPGLNEFVKKQKMLLDAETKLRAVAAEIFRCLPEQAVEILVIADTLPDKIADHLEALK